MKFERSPLRGEIVNTASQEFKGLNNTLRQLIYLRNAAISAAISAYECQCANCKKFALGELLTYQAAVAQVYGTSDPERRFLDDLAGNRVKSPTCLFEKNGHRRDRVTSTTQGPDSDKTTA